MSEVEFRKHRVFRETEDVIFYDISVEKSNASDLVVHTGRATSPPDDLVGERTFELVNFDWKYPYHIVHLNRQSGALMIPTHTYHRSVSGDTGSIVINQAIRKEGFDAKYEFIPVSSASDKLLYDILLNEKPIVHTLGE